MKLTKKRRTTRARYDFDGFAAFVTGAGGGIGMEIARYLLDAGCHVTAMDIKPCPARFADFGSRLIYQVGDVTDPAQVDAAVETAAAGGLDFVVNAAGVAIWGDSGAASDGSIVEIDMEVWNRTLAINLNGAINVVRAAVPRMLATGGGSLVHIASIVGLRSMDNALQAGPMDAYQASKAALIALSHSLAITYGKSAIRSNTICPGAVRTPMTEAIYQQEARLTSMAERTPLNRVGMPPDIAEAAMFLLSDSADFITGADLVVDGGLSVKLG